MKDFKTFSDFMNQVNEIFLVTPPPRRRSSNSATRSASKPKMGKPDPKDPNYVEKMRKWAKQQQQEETSVSEDMEQRWERRAEGRREREERDRERRKAREEKDKQRSEVSTKGVPFYDKQGEGYIKGGVKTYTKRN